MPHDLLGKRAPAFSASDQEGTKHTLSGLKGSWVLLYFYPKDDTPGCTKEACSFRDALPKFKTRQVRVLGVSIDSVKKHQKFALKFKLRFPLLSDEERKIVNDYHVWGEKKFMGRQYMGTFRMSFLINPAGKIVKVYEHVKPEEHPKEVLADLKVLQA